MVVPTPTLLFGNAIRSAGLCHPRLLFFPVRHGLIVIIAIGEALVAIGVGARGVGLDTSVIVAAVLGFAVAASFWLAYFDFFTIRAQQLLIDRTGSERVALALMAALWAVLHAYELIWFSQARAETRAQRVPEVSPVQSPAHLPPRP